MTDVLTRSSSCDMTFSDFSADAAPAQGACTVLPCQEAAAADLYFSERPAELEAAKALCGPCPLREMCLEGALRRAEPWGVWGGQILENGAVIAVKRGRGRPRKDAAAAA